MEKKRLKLSQLKVQSFRTSLDNKESETLKGGVGAPTNYSDCGTGVETIICCAGPGNSMNVVCHSQVAACQNTDANVCVVEVRTLIVDGNNICV